MNEDNVRDLYIRLKSGDENSLNSLFKRFYSPLCLYAFQFLHNKAASEEIVQDLFVKIWEIKESLNIQFSLKSYLFNSVKNKCLNYIEHEKIKNKYTQKVLSEPDYEVNPDDFFIEPDLLLRIEKSINSLPPKRGEIFRLSREKGLKYKEIALELGISVKTVEAQMGLAIKQLRNDLKDYRNHIISFYIVANKKRLQ